MIRRISASAAVLAAVCAGAMWAQIGPGAGKRSELLQPCDELYDRGERTRAAECFASLVRSNPDPGLQAEAFWRLGDFKRANELFRAAVKAKPEDPDLRVRWGYLFLQTHNESEAGQLFQEALEIDEDHVPAKLGMARLMARRFEGKGPQLVEEALEAEPDQVEGHLLLARMALEEGDTAKADKQLDIALEKANRLGVSPLEVYALKASADLVRGVTESEWTQKALALNPLYGEIHAQPAHFYVITRRYREALELYRKAVEVDPELWSAHADLAVTLLREGREAEARRHLEIAYNGDPYSYKTVNTLRLLDSLEKNFRTFSNKDRAALSDEQQMQAALAKPEVIVKLHEKEAELLRPYVIDLADRSIGTFRKKYGFTPQRPIQVELYPDHDDFAVRTLGTPGVGLLGVTFGYVIAMDSPSARRPGNFHWGTTLWHEMAHVFTLEATNHLVPRWYSEGISMYEEWAADPSWGERVSPEFVKAFQEEKLLPVAELDRGFIRPRYPSQVAVSYFQAGLVCQMIAEQWEFQKLVELLDGFAEDKPTEDNIEAVLGISHEEFDQRFLAYVEERYGTLTENLDEWRKNLKAALEAAREENWEEVMEPAREAQQIYPDFVEAGNSYKLLAEAFLNQGDKRAAAGQLLLYRDRGGRDPETLRQLAQLLDETSQREEAIRTLEALLYIWPADTSLHDTLGQWLLSEGRVSEALREFESHLALNPLDRAGAHYNLAKTYHKMMDPERTRRHLLMSLEAAPSYRPAQQLLLEIAR